MLNHLPEETIFTLLEKLPERFYLTGSRFFGTQGQNSDWDYFTENSDEVFLKLKDLGFVKISARTYGDANSARVMRWTAKHTKLQVDVQLVHDVELKRRVQERFVKIGFVPTSRDSWDLAFALDGVS